MAYHKCNINKGFTLVEMVVVLGLLTLFLTLSEVVYVKAKSASSLKIGTDSLVETIRYAEINSQNSKGNSSWGIKIFPNNMVVFSGVNYSSRDTGLDLLLDFPTAVTASGDSEFVFNKLTGWPTSTGNIVLTNDSGSTNISINEKGTITYE